MQLVIAASPVSFTCLPGLHAIGLLCSDNAFYERFGRSLTFTAPLWRNTIITSIMDVITTMHISGWVGNQMCYVIIDFIPLVG